MPILWVFKTDVFVVQKGFFTIQNVKKSFFHDLLSRSMTWEYSGLQGVTRGYKGLHGVTRGCRGLQGVTSGERGVTRE